MGRIKKSNVILTCGLAFFGAAFALGAVVTVNSVNNQTYEVAQADGGIQYNFREWNETNKEVEDTSRTCETYTTVTSGTTSWTNGWYVVSNNVTIASRVTVTGTANLILCDGATLTAPNGINVSVGNSLNVFDQTNGTGSIIATSNTNDVSGIGGGYNGAGGGVIIYGGTVTATGASYAAGIGGGYNGTGGGVIIYGGTVTASSVKDGAGIGGGLYGTGGNVTVYGGTVTATGGSDAAGIGGGYGRAGGEVIIYGGTVTATGGSSAAGIGGGYNGAHGSLTINETSLGVFGGNSQDPTDRINKVNNDYARYRYMVVKALPTYTVTLDPNNGSSGEHPTVTVTSGAAMPSTTMPTWENHTFQGFFDGTEGTGNKYYNANGTSARNWDKSSNTTLYAYWSTNIAFDAVTGAEYTYDGNAHTISGISFKDAVTDTALTGYTLKYSSDSGSTYTLDSAPTFTDAGAHTIYYQVTKDGYTTLESTVALNITKANPTPVETLNATYGQTLSDIALPAGWAWDDATASVGNAGNNSIAATFAEQTNYNEGHQNVTVVVAKADPSAVGSLNAVYGQTLSDVALPAGWAWDDATTTSVGNAGNHSFSATFAEQANYNEGHQDVTIDVAKVDSVITSDPVGATGLNYDGTAHALLTSGGSATGGTLKYKVGSSGMYSTAIPTATEPGSYRVYYKVFGDENHNDLEGSLKVKINGPVSYQAWNGSSVEDVDGGRSEYTVITNSTTTLQDGHWYVVEDDVTITGSITVTGNVHLILCDDWTLTVDGGIYVPYGNTINIYSQSDDVNQGRLIADGKGPSNSGRGAGIGGNYNKGNDIAGTINIHGGTISASGGTYGAGIGGSAGFHSNPRRANAGTVNIYGGNITATGNSAAGIGGGNEGAGGTVVICGGTVTATGGTYGAGIGGGQKQNGGTIIISGGNVTARGASYSAGIGGGGDGGSCGSITISGGIVTATGGHNAAGIGGGDEGGSGGSITISGGMVTANGGIDAKGIGAGQGGSSNGTLNAINGCFVFGSDDHAIDLNNIDLNDKQDNYSNTRWKYMGVKVMHVHNFTSYSASGNTATATCANDDTYPCYLEDYKTYLVVSAPANLAYSGTAKAATLNAGYSTEAFQNVAISYQKWNGSEYIDIESDQVVGIGRYRAYVNYSGSGSGSDSPKKPFVIFEIVKANSEVTTAPTGVNNLSYTGSAQELVNAGTATGGTLMYKLGENGIYSESIPTATNAGNYTVYYKVFGDENHNDTDENSVVVNIAKVASSVTTAPTAKDNLASDGTEVVELINAGTATGGTIQYKLNDGEYSSNIPTVINPGVYTVYYKVVGDENHNDIAEESFNVTVVERIHYRAWNGTSVVDVEGGCINYTVITESTTTLEDGLWYVLKNNVTIPTRITVNGNAHIILCDGCTLTASEGITVNAENTLNIYGQTAGTGKIVATGINNTAGIGGDANTTGGMVNIHAIVIEATGGNHGAGIGGGYKNGGYVNIYGGEIVARGGFGGAGIGGGAGYNGGTVNVHGGTVTAIGNSAAGIGAGIEGSSQGDLIVDEGIHVFGGTSADDLEEKTNYDTQRWDYMFIVAHEHNWSYVSNGNSITATCLNPDCPETEGLTLTLVAEDSVYDGTVKIASFVPGYNNAAFANPTISYYLNNTLVAECINAGTYEARVTFGGQTAALEFVIAQAIPTGYDIPTGLVATYGDDVSSVTLPTNWSWKSSTDKVGNAGDREHVAIYTPADTNYKAVEEMLTIAVAKATPTYVAPKDIEAPYDVTLSKVALPEGFSWMDNTQVVNKWGEQTYKAKFTPSDTTNYNIIENIDIKVNVKWILVDPTQGDVNVTISDGEASFDVNIKVEVKVKTEISVDQKRTDYANLATETFVSPNEDIMAIYDVKLIRTTNGVEEEIQPSDIKEGTTIYVQMAIPEELVGKSFRLLHIHNADDIVEVTNYFVSQDGKTLTVVVDRLSEFAFVGALPEGADNGFDYNTTPVWAVVLLIIFGLLLLVGLFFLFILLKKKDDDDDDEEKKEPVKAMSIAFIAPLFVILNAVNGVVIAFIVVAVLTVLVWGANAFLFIKRKNNKKEQVKEEPASAIEEKEELESSKEEPAPKEEQKVKEIKDEPKVEKKKTTRTLKQTIAVASALSSSSKWNKETIAKALKESHGDEVEINTRGNFTSTGLPLADTHYAVDKETRKCFIYVYETSGAPLLLINADDKLMDEVKKKHSDVSRSAFPKSKDDWYSIPLDDSYTDKEVQVILDYAHALALGRNEQGLSIKDSLAMASASKGVHTFNKLAVVEYLSNYKEVETNNRKNYTSTGLPLADTHYLTDEKGKKSCFIYVYETSGAMMFLIKANDEFVEGYKGEHKNISRSAFPKSKDKWYTAILDESYSDDDVKKLLDDLIAFNK